MRPHSAYQARPRIAQRIAISLSREETVGLINFLTQCIELSYEASKNHNLPRLLEDLSKMAKRRGWLSD